MTDDLVERVARHIYLATWSDVGGKWEAVETKDVWRGYVRAALSAIEDAGFVIVPVEPTMAQLRALGAGLAQGPMIYNRVISARPRITGGTTTSFDEQVNISGGGT